MTIRKPFDERSYICFDAIEIELPTGKETIQIVGDGDTQETVTLEISLGAGPERDKLLQQIGMLPSQMQHALPMDWLWQNWLEPLTEEHDLVIPPRLLEKPFFAKYGMKAILNNNRVYTPAIEPHHSAGSDPYSQCVSITDQLKEVLIGTPPTMDNRLPHTFKAYLCEDLEEPTLKCVDISGPLFNFSYPFYEAHRPGWEIFRIVGLMAQYICHFKVKPVFENTNGRQLLSDDIAHYKNCVGNTIEEIADRFNKLNPEF